jgi:CubicO group peptidase (beta-lactamase class C family)
MEERVRAAVLVFLVALLFASCSSATPVPLPTAEPEVSEELAAEVDAYLNGLVEQDLFSGAVLLAREGQVLYAQGYGPADRGQGIENTPETRFPILSITKQFTAMAVLMLQAEDKLNVQDPVCQYIEDCPAAWEEITIHHLLTHTAGLVDPPEFSDQTFDELMGSLQNSALAAEPGTGWQYCNVCYALLGYVVEQLSGQTYPEFIQAAILDLLEMDQTDFDADSPDCARGMSGSEGVPREPIPAVLYSAGGIVSTVGDLFRWDRALARDTLLPAEALEEMFAAQFTFPPLPGSAYPMAYGYGWLILENPDRRTVYHPGSWPGFRSLLGRYPDDDVTIIVLSNQEDALLFEAIWLADIYLALEEIVFGQG